MKFRKGVTKEELTKKLRQVESAWQLITGPQDNIDHHNLLLKKTIIIQNLEKIINEDISSTKLFYSKVPEAMEAIKMKIRELEEKEK